MKKKLIFGSALGIIMCSSLIAGATMALFTSESKVNIAVTSGKVEVSAEAKEVTTYTNGEVTENGTFKNKGTAVIDDSGKLVLSGITPGDKAVVKLEITNGSSVAYKQRISLSSTLDAEFMDQLIVGVSEDNQSYTYYSDYVTAWEKGEPVEEPVTTTMYLSIELPAYVGDDWQGKEGEIALAVEAVQGNADVTSTTVANEVYLVNNQEELTNAIAEMQRGETVILYGGEENWATANIEYTEVKEITVRGYKVGTMTINAPNGTVNLYSDVESLTVTSIADNSLHIYGNIVSAKVADGRAVVEPGAYVENVNVVPSESNSVKFEVKATVNNKAAVNNITVNTSNSASSADVVIAEGVEVADMTVEGSGDVTLNNSGTISNTTVSEGSNLNSAVATAEQLIAALKISGTTVTLGADIELPEQEEYVLSSGAKILDLNQYTLSFGETEIWVSGGHNFTIKNGSVRAKPTSDIIAGGFCVQKDSVLSIESVNYQSLGSGFFLQGENATLNVTNSEVVIRGYGVTTNASGPDNYGVVANLLNSSFSTLDKDSTGTTILLNVPCTLTMTGCTVTGTMHGVVMRGGSAYIEDSTIMNNASEEECSEDLLNYFDNANWGTGNMITLGALVLGNKLPGASYQYPTYCKLTNTTIESGYYNALYAYGNSTEGNGVTVDFGENVKIIGDLIKGNDKVIFNGFAARADDIVYATLNDAFDIAKQGSVIYLAPGTVEEGLTINKPVTIDGGNSAVIAGKVRVESEDVILKNLTVSVEFASADDQTAPVSTNNKNLTLKNCKIIRATELAQPYGMLVDVGTATLTASDTQFIAPFDPDSAFNASPSTIQAGSVDLDGCTISTDGYGIFSQHVTNGVIKNTVFTGIDGRPILGCVNSTLLEGLVFDGCTFEMGYNSNVLAGNFTFTNCTFDFTNTPDDGAGNALNIYGETGQIVIENNKFILTSNDQRGLNLTWADFYSDGEYDCTNVSFTGNIFEGTSSEYAVRIVATSGYWINYDENQLKESNSLNGGDVTIVTQ